MKAQPTAATTATHIFRLGVEGLVVDGITFALPSESLDVTETLTVDFSTVTYTYRPSASAVVIDSQSLYIGHFEKTSTTKITSKSPIATNEVGNMCGEDHVDSLNVGVGCFITGGIESSSLSAVVSILSTSELIKPSSTLRNVAFAPELRSKAHVAVILSSILGVLICR